MRAGEFVAGEVEDLMDTDELVESACREIVEQTQARRSVLVFATGVQHGEHVAAVLRRDGERAGRPRSSARRATRSATGCWRSSRPGKIKYLVNVNVLTTGFDAPNIDCVAMVRPTLSPGLYYQMVGRGFRLERGQGELPGPGLRRQRAAARAGRRHPHPERSTIAASGEAPAKECPECQSLIAAGYAVCPDCGYEFPPPERRKHEATASTEGILSGEVTTTESTRSARSATASTARRGAPDDAPRTLRVEYRIGFHQYQSEWICFEHTGWARQKAESWWRTRSNAPVPRTAAEAAVAGQ